MLLRRLVLQSRGLFVRYQRDYWRRDLKGHPGWRDAMMQMAGVFLKSRLFVVGYCVCIVFLFLVLRGGCGSWIGFRLS